MKVWVIEQGEYSDYRVAGVFSSKENADRVAEKINKGEPYERATVSEWPFDPAINELNAGLKQFSVRMSKDGTVEFIYERGEFDSSHLTSEFWVWPRSKAPAYAHYNPKPQDALNAAVWAEDEKHAIKITNEKRLQLIALNQWEKK